MQERLDLSSFLHLFGCCHTRRILNHLKCEWINMAGYGQYMLSSTQWLGCAFPISKRLEYQQCIYIHIYICIWDVHGIFHLCVTLSQQSLHGDTFLSILGDAAWIFVSGRSRNMLKIQGWKKNRRNAWWPLSGFQRLEKMWETPIYGESAKRKMIYEWCNFFSTCFGCWRVDPLFGDGCAGKSTIEFDEFSISMLISCGEI